MRKKYAPVGNTCQDFRALQAGRREDLAENPPELLIRGSMPLYYCVDLKKPDGKH